MVNSEQKEKLGNAWVHICGREVVLESSAILHEEMTSILKSRLESLPAKDMQEARSGVNIYQSAITNTWYGVHRMQDESLLIDGYEVLLYDTDPLVQPNTLPSAQIMVDVANNQVSVWKMEEGVMMYFAKQEFVVGVVVDTLNRMSPPYTAPVGKQAI